MAYSHLLPLSLCLFLLFHGCFAQLELHQQQLWQNLQQEQQHSLRAKTKCNIQQLTAQEPTIKLQSEAGVTEHWDSSHPMFECAGVEVERRVIQQKGLLLPHFLNAPKLVYVIEGSGLFGAVFPGCAETYESQSGSFGQQGQGQGQGQMFGDRHQKLRRFQQGDIIALPAGITHWAYNDGDVPVVVVSLIDVANEANQLDLTLKQFLVAGNPRSRQQSYGQVQQGQGQQGQQKEAGNILNGFDDDLLAEIFQIDSQTARKLKGQEDQRGPIVRADQLQLSIPEYGQQEQQRRQQQGQGEGQGGGQGWKANGIEETLCTVKLRENIAHPTRADFFNPRAGRISRANSHTLPILSLLQLSAERGFLYSNAIHTPHWNLNAHNVLYVIRGSARIQVVGDQGNSVFNDEVTQGQLIIVPQNFAVVKKAGNQGFEYIAFKTNANSMSTPIAGRLSVIRDMPLAVLMNAYRLDRNEAQQLKNNRQEATLLSSYSGRSEHA